MPRRETEELICTVVIWQDGSGGIHQWDIYQRSKDYVMSMLGMIMSYGAFTVHYIEEFYRVKTK